VATEVLDLGEAFAFLGDAFAFLGDLLALLAAFTFLGLATFLGLVTFLGLDALFGLEAFFVPTFFFTGLLEADLFFFGFSGVEGVPVAAVDVVVVDAFLDFLVDFFLVDLFFSFLSLRLGASLKDAFTLTKEVPAFL
jgi:hypothetical protein